MDVPEADTFFWHSRYPSAGQNAISAPSMSARCAAPACCRAQDGDSRWAMDATRCFLAQNTTSSCLAATGVALLSWRRSVFRRQLNHREICGPAPPDPRASDLAGRIGQMRGEHSLHELGEEEVIYGLPRLILTCTGTMPQSWQRPETSRQANESSNGQPRRHHGECVDTRRAVLSSYIC